MRLYDYLPSLARWANAESIFTHITDVVETSQSLQICEFLFDLFDNARIQFVDTLAGDEVGVVNNQNWNAYQLPALAAENGYEDLTFGDIAEEIKDKTRISITSSLLEIFTVAEDENCDALLVEVDGRINGSICLADVMKEPSLLYLSTLAFAVEAEVVELCSLFPETYLCLSAQSQKESKQLCLQKKSRRLKEYLEIAKDCGIVPNRDTLLRERIQTTMMSDKKTMLLKSELGLTSSNSRIRHVFQFCEKVRNYFGHPSATFTRDRQEAAFLENANHEQIQADGTSAYLVSQSIASELSIGRLPELAKNVRWCHELIADVRKAICTRTNCPPE